MDPIALANAGPWAVVVAIGVGLAFAFFRESFVQGSIYKREVKRADDATTALASMAKSLDALTQEVRRGRDRERRRDAS